MDSNPYAFNRDVSYPTCAGFPRNMTCKDILEAHIQVVIPEKVSDGRGDFTAEVEDIFDHYRLPHISSEKILNRWHQSPMDFYQNHVNLAVWLATSGCGVSWRDHLDIDRPLARSVFRFHVYYQVRRILEELQAPLPQDRAWSPFQNPYDRRAYERICREFGVDPATDWRANGPNHGLGQVYFYVTHTGYRPIYGVGDPNHYDPSRMSFGQNTTNSIVHVDYIAQGPEADEAWSTFILDKSQGFTAPGVERVNDSIRTYVWAILGAQAQTRSAILGTGTSFDAQKQFLANVEDAISSPAFGTGLYMAPSDMRLHIGTAIAGYNNQIIIAPAGQPLGVSPDTNNTPVPAPVETGETGLVVPQTHDKPDTSGVTTMTQAPSAVAPPMTHSVVPVVPPEQTQKAQDHEDEKTALVAAGVVLGLVSLWLMRR